MRRSEFFRKKAEAHASIYSLHDKRETVSAITVEELDFVIHPGVFDPTYGVSSELLASAVAKLVKGVVLDIGCGAGIQGLVAASKGNQAVLTDVSHNAVSCAKENTRLLTLESSVDVLEGDAFTPVRGYFDWIVCNPPFFYKKPSDALDRAFCDEDYKFLGRVVADSRQFVNRNGKLLLSFSDLGDFDFLQFVLRAAHLRWEETEYVIEDGFRYFVLLCSFEANS